MEQWKKQKAKETLSLLEKNGRRTLLYWVSRHLLARFPRPSISDERPESFVKDEDPVPTLQGFLGSTQGVYLTPSDQTTLAVHIYISPSQPHQSIPRSYSAPYSGAELSKKERDLVVHLCSLCSSQPSTTGRFLRLIKATSIHTIRHSNTVKWSSHPQQSRTRKRIINS